MLDSHMRTLVKDKQIVIYDGTCGFCDSTVRFVLDQNPKDNLRFVSHQSELGTALRAEYDVKEGAETIVLINDSGYAVKSKAIFGILRQVRSSYKYLALLSFIPSTLSDFFYDIVARNRHRIQGQACMIPTMKEKKFFLG